MRRFLGAALLTAMLASAWASDAKAPTVTVGAITSEVATKPEIRRELKSAIVSELGKLDLSNAKERFVLSAALVTLETVTERDHVQTTCVVNAQLAKKAGGTLRAVFRGRARATDAKNAVKTAELAALQGAVKSAMRGLPQAVR
jgi:hypothetical protein